MSTTVVEAPGIAKLVQQGAVALQQGSDLRQMQAANSPQASNYDQRGFQGANNTSLPLAFQNAVTANEVYSIPEAQVSAKIFYQLIVTFDAASGSGRYRTDGGTVSPVLGHAIPAGGIVLVITGHNNIRNFQMQAEAGQLLTFSRNLYI